MKKRERQSRRKRRFGTSFFKCFIIGRREKKAKSSKDGHTDRQSRAGARKRPPFPKHLQKREVQTQPPLPLPFDSCWFLVVVLEVNTSRTLNDNTSSTAARMPHRRGQGGKQTGQHIYTAAESCPGDDTRICLYSRPAGWAVIQKVYLMAGPDRLYIQAQLREDDRKRISKRLPKDIKNLLHSQRER